MKSKNCITLMLLLAISFVFCLSGCEQKNRDTDGGTYVMIIKFKLPEYKNYILANFHEGDSVITITTEHLSCVDSISHAGSSPYWELSDNWLLLDWKWVDFLDFVYNDVLLTDLTWDSIEHPVTRPQLTWSASTPHIDKPIDKLTMVTIEKIVNYHESFSPNLYSWFDKMTDSCLCPCEYVQDMDEDWFRLQRNLSVAIENGDLEKLQ